MTDLEFDEIFDAMPPAEPATPAATQTDHEVVHKLYASLNELTTKMETAEVITLLNTDLGEWIKVLQEKLSGICSTRANMIRFCMDLAQTTNKELYTAYIAEYKENEVKRFSSSALNDAQQGIGGFVIEQMEKHKIPLAATMRRMVFNEYKAGTIALRACMRTNTKVHGSAPSKIAFKLKKMFYDKTKYENISQYLNAVNDANDMLRGSALHTPEYKIFLYFTEELRELYTQVPTDTEFGKLVQNLTTIQLSCDWKEGREADFPKELGLILTTEIAAYDAHNAQVVTRDTTTAESQAMLVRKLRNLKRH